MSSADTLNRALRALPRRCISALRVVALSAAPFGAAPSSNIEGASIALDPRPMSCLAKASRIWS